MSALPTLQRPGNASNQLQTKLRNRYEVDLSNYEQLSMIKCGTFGFVYKIRDKKTRQYYAAKTVLCGNDEGECERVISREVDIMNTIHHQTIVEYIGYSRYDFSKMKNVTIIMEFAEMGSLRDLLNRVQISSQPSNYDNTIRQIILVGIARGMKYLHDRSIIHRDLKPENIVINKELHPLITDFGLSKFFEYGKSQDQSRNPGTPFYMAPEVYKGQPFGRKCDVYSFAILMYEVVTDLIPFDGMNLFDLPKIAYENTRPKFNCKIKDKIKDLIEKCWDKDPKERPTFKVIFELLSNVENDDYLLDNVDVNALKIYLETICNKGDPVENILKELDDVKLKEEEMKMKYKENEDELVELTNENKNLTLQNELYKKEIQKLRKEAMLIHNKSNEYERDLQSLHLDFNSLSLSEQKELSAIMSNADSGKRTELFTKIDKLISYLKQLKGIQEEKCIEISIDHKSKNDEDYDEESEDEASSDNFEKIRIQLQSAATEIAYKNKLFESRNFQKLMKSFTIFSIEIKYPSSEFKSTYKMACKLKKNEIIKRISIFISGIVETDLEFCKDENIDIVKFDSSVTTIKSTYDEESDVSKGSFEFCSNLSEIVIPSSITSIGNNAFCECSSLTQITIPSSVTSIGKFAFHGCSSLTQITIPSSVTSIEYSLFTKCSSLTQIIIPSSVTSIEEFSFSECSSLTQITIPSSVTSIGNYAFCGCSSLIQITIPSSVTKIGWHAFEKCSSLIQITIPSSVTEIKNDVFSKCSSLIQIKIPSSVTEIGDGAFRECSSLTEIVFEIPSSITYIEKYAFFECSSLKKITIPSSVTYIGERAFSECSALSQITIPSSLTSFGKDAFSKSQFQKITKI